MTLHPMRAVVIRTGLSSHALRMWETRYGAIAPDRSAGGQRLYSDEDLDRLLLLRRHLHLGRRIGQLAALGTDELRALLGGGAETPGHGEALAESVQAAVVGALEELDAPGLERVLGGGLLELGLAAFVDAVALPLIEETDGPIPRRLLARALESILATARTGLPRRAEVGRVIVASPAREPHEVDLQALATIAAAEGAEVIYLGADLPVDALASAAAGSEVRIVAVAAAGNTGLRRARAALEELRNEIPRRVALLVWTPAGPRAGDLKGVGLAAGQEELRAFFRTYH